MDEKDIIMECVLVFVLVFKIISITDFENFEDKQF